MQRPEAADDDLLQRIRGEFVEMPGLRLTGEQAQRLWRLDETTCMRILNTLVDLKFLQRGSDACYARMSDERLPAVAARMAKADVVQHEDGRARRHPKSSRGA